MIETKIAGLKCAHRMITPECRKNRGTTPAYLVAAEEIQAIYDRYSRDEANEQVTWHLVLVRSEPTAE